MNAGLCSTDGEQMKAGIDFAWTAEWLNTKSLLKILFIGFLALAMQLIKDAVMYNVEVRGDEQGA